MPTAFISGHTDLTQEEFDKHYVPLLQRSAKSGDKFVTAAAFGADRMAIDYLVKNKVPKKHITIYLHNSYRDREEGYLDEGFKVSTGYKTHLERDEAMTFTSNYDIAWLRSDEEARAMYGQDWEKGETSATEKNILRRKVTQVAEEVLKREVAAIKNVLPIGSSTFSCNGTYKVAHPVEIYFKGKNYENDGSIHAVITPMEEEKMKKLVNACKVATFGIGKEEVADETYRKAGKLDTDAFATSFQLCDTEILRVVHRVLAPNTDSIRAELYKLNIYEEGGFFKAHKDTPRGSGMFGSLVICLDQPFKGGELVVKHNGRSITYGESMRTPGSLHWMAFFSDCTHEVLPVTSGNRVTLTYNLYRQSDSTIENVTPTISQELYETLGNCIKGGGLKGKILGFSLEHVYVQGSTVFKGNDLLLMNTLRALEKAHPSVGAKPYLRPNVEESYDEDDDSEDKDEELFIKWGDFSNGDELYDRSADARYFEESYGAERYNVTWVNEPRYVQYTDTVAAYGNEPTTENLYCAGCILFFLF